MIFSTNRTPNYLSESEWWFMDETFDISPKLFTQIFTVRAECGTSAATCIYALIKGKSENICHELFNNLAKYVQDNLQVLINWKFPTLL